MMEEDMIITLNDDKEYYVLDSLMYNNYNYIMIGEMDRAKDEITDNIKIMYYDGNTNSVKKVTDPNALYRLTQMFAERTA